MRLTRRKVIGGGLGVFTGLVALGAVVSDPNDVDFSVDTGDDGPPGPEEWLEQHRSQEQSALESYREGARLIEDEDYALARPKMADAQEGYRGLFLAASEREGETFDQLAQYYNLMKAAAGSAKQACVSALQGDTNDANQYMETALNQHNEAQQVREELQDSI